MIFVPMADSDRADSQAALEATSGLAGPMVKATVSRADPPQADRRAEAAGGMVVVVISTAAVVDSPVAADSAADGAAVADSVVAVDAAAVAEAAEGVSKA
jgi:hypothetical protein